MSVGARPVEIECAVNGEDVSVTVPPYRTLVEMLREDLDLTGTSEGCGVGVCGSCTVLVDGRTVSSCFELAMNVEGADVWTVEGLATREEGPDLHPLQEAFQDNEGFQCGYCTPGMLASATALLAENPNPTRDDIETHLSENLCRCTGYEQIIDSVSEAANRL